MLPVRISGVASAACSVAQRRGDEGEREWLSERNYPRWLCHMPSLRHEGKEESLRDGEQEQCMFVHAFLKQNLSLTLTPRSLAAKVGL